MEYNLSKHTHRRFNLLNGEWVLVSPARSNRPWKGYVVKSSHEKRPMYDPECFLCPGNTRASGIRNPDYKSTFVFNNDFPTFELDVPNLAYPPHPILNSHEVQGACQVVCYSPRHDLTLPEMSISNIQAIVDTWIDRTAELGSKYKWVQVFENKGDMVGCSITHPHGHIWAMNFLPNEPTKEDRQQRDYYDEHEDILLLNYLALELDNKTRIVRENKYWSVLVPFWAVWPFETLLIPKRHVPRLTDLTSIEKESLSSILKDLLVLYDNLFKTSFPYCMGWHGAPFGENVQIESYWQLHAHFYPPLLRSATEKKFMAGFEMLSEALRDLTVEKAAQWLRSLPTEHFKELP